MMSIFQSIKFRLIAFGLLLLVAGLSLRLMVALPFAQDQLHEVMATEQLSIATYVARDVDHSIQVRRTLIGELAEALPPALLAQPAGLTSWLKERQRLNPLFSNGLAVLRPDATGLFAEYPLVPGRDRLEYSESDWFRAALHANGPVMGRPQRGRASGEPLLVMAAAVHDDAGRMVAVLAGAAALNAPGFLDGMQTTRLGETGSFLLISPSDKLVVAASDPAMILQATPLPGVDLLHDKAMAGYRGTGKTTNANGVEEMEAIVAVPSTGWFVVARIASAEAYRPIAAMRGFILKYTLIGIFLLTAILLIGLPRMLRPLTEAARAIRSMADGTSELAPLPVHRQDEVGDLVVGFNTLVARLREKEAALKASEKWLDYMAHHDSLTGLYNRAMLEDRLDQAVARAERDGSSFALLFCDLDGFKPINDQFGHETGDAVLRQVALRFLEGRRRTDTVARLGGDEFVVLLTDLKDMRSTAAKVGQQLLEAIRRPFDLDGKDFALSVSIGISLCHTPDATASQLLSQADIAMYRAKRAGKNSFCFFDDVAPPLKAVASD